MNDLAFTDSDGCDGDARESLDGVEERYDVVFGSFADLLVSLCLASVELSRTVPGIDGKHLNISLTTASR